MTDWRLLSEAVDPPIPAAQAELIAPPLEKLESDLHKLVERLPIDTLLWNGPSEK